MPVRVPGRFKARLASAVHAWREYRLVRELPASARRQVQRDRKGPPQTDPGAGRVIEAAIGWLCRAQDHSASADGGVSRDFSLRSGWATSYPETTGYIVPTFLDHATRTGDQTIRARAARMLDWLSKTQLPSGAIQGGKIDSMPVVPVPFNTGQVLLGFAAGERAFGNFGAPMRKAADWLVAVQDPDGCWRRFQTPFAVAGDKAFDTHIAWGLFEAARIEANRGYAEAALANVRWALTHQRENGWFDKCCLSNMERPLTHTIGYALRGVIEAYRYTREPLFLQAARSTADGVLTALRADGYLPGTLASDWSASADWTCLTGTAQIAYCWLALYQETADPRYREAGFLANSFVRRLVAVDGDEDIRGAVGGSFPIDGRYCQYAYPNWAAKFLIDSLVLELEVRGSTSARPAD